MGSCVSTVIAINLHGNNSFYFTGQTVSGTVGLNIMQEKVEADEIYITLTGEIGYTTQHTVSNGTGQATTYTKYHHVPFYSAKITFARPEVGQSELISLQGQYSWPFQIPLSNHLPPTLNRPQSYPHVRYYLQVVIDKPWYKANTKETRYLTVYPRVNLLQNPQCLQPTIFKNQNRKDITLKGTLNKIGYVPGELIHITLKIENPRRALIERIDVSMFQTHQIGVNSNGHTIFETTLPTILNLKDEQINETFSITFPSVRIPPSYQFQGGIQRPAVVCIGYILKFVVKVEGIFTNFNIDVPVILGTEPIPDLNQQQTSNPEQLTFTDYDLPPSYESVVQNTI
jgi:hypothetical protein